MFMFWMDVSFLVYLNVGVAVVLFIKDLDLLSLLCCWVSFKGWDLRCGDRGATLILTLGIRIELSSELI